MNLPPISAQQAESNAVLDVPSFPSSGPTMITAPVHLHLTCAPQSETNEGVNVISSNAESAPPMMNAA